MRQAVPAGIATVRLATDSDAARWDEFVSCRAGSFYHLWAWRAVLGQHMGHRPVYLLAEHAGELVGVLPLVLISSKLFGRILCSLPFLNFAGPLGTTPAIESQLLAAAVNQIDALSADYLEVRCPAEVTTPLQASLRKVSLTIRLPCDADTAWSSYSSKHRNNIRRAEKLGLTVSSGGAELLPDFYSVMLHSWRAHGTPIYSLRFFEHVMQSFPGQTRIFRCQLNGQTIAAALNGQLHGTVEGMWAGSMPESRKLQPNYVLYWAMIKHACNAGLSEFHLGRSSAGSNAEDFKRKWNATPQQLYWYQQGRAGKSPDLNVNNPKFRLAISIWRRLPLVATRLFGPRLARLIP